MAEQKHDDWLRGLGIDVGQLRQTGGGSPGFDPTIDPDKSIKVATGLATGGSQEALAFVNSTAGRIANPTVPLVNLGQQGIDALVNRDPSKIDPVKALTPSDDITQPIQKIQRTVAPANQAQEKQAIDEQNQALATATAIVNDPNSLIALNPLGAALSDPLGTAGTLQQDASTLEKRAADDPEKFGEDAGRAGTRTLIAVAFAGEGAVGALGDAGAIGAATDAGAGGAIADTGVGGGVRPTVIDPALGGVPPTVTDPVLAGVPPTVTDPALAAPGDASPLAQTGVGPAPPPGPIVVDPAAVGDAPTLAPAGDAGGPLTQRGLGPAAPPAAAPPESGTVSPFAQSTPDPAAGAPAQSASAQPPGTALDSAAPSTLDPEDVPTQRDPPIPNPKEPFPDPDIRLKPFEPKPLRTIPADPEPEVAPDTERLPAPPAEPSGPAAPEPAGEPAPDTERTPETAISEN